MTDPRHAIIAEAISASRETLRGYLIDERLFSAMADQIIAALDAARPAFDLVAHLHRQREFSARTFGPGARTKGVVDHIRKELAEIEADPADIMEWVDVVILAFDGAWRAGWEPEAIVEAIVAKQTKNEARTWPDWRTADPDKAIEHVRASDAAQPAEPQEYDATDAIDRAIRNWSTISDEPPADEGAAGGPLPCPFCGGPAKTYQYNGTTQAVCCSAEYVDCPGSTCDAPVAMWNRRAAEAEIARLTRERDEARETVSCWEETEFGVRPDDDARTAEAATAAIEDMTTTDELREAVARQLDPAAFHTLLSSEPSLRKREARSKADRIIRLVVDACARPCDDFDAPPSDSDFVNGQATAAQQIRARIRELAPKEPAP